MSSDSNQLGYKLRPYQKKAVDSAVNYFRKQRKPATIVLPTGAGKSLVIAQLAKIANGRVLVLAHVRELVEQNHEKYQSYGLNAGIFSAGLNRKDTSEKVIFGGIQSVVRAESSFFKDFSLVIIDECHRVSNDPDSQYQKVISKLREKSPAICILGLTATPYRLGLGWIYKYHSKGILRTDESRFFEKCIFEIGLKEMIRDGYLTPPVKLDSPVAAYDFSELKLSTSKEYSVEDIETVLKKQKRVTPLIVNNIYDLSEDRVGVIIFTASVRHAEEVLSYLPPEESSIILGSTPSEERDTIVKNLKARKLKFLVNVSVLTTGFDAPHIDLIAILRPTESISLFQQIVGRGLRLSEGKKDCLVLDYTGMDHSIFNPEIEEKKPSEDSVPVKVKCPECNFENDFWGIVDSDGNIIEHFGRKCHGATEDPKDFSIVPCRYRFRFKLCNECGEENDIAARECARCSALLVDNDTKLKEARAMKDAHVMRPDLMDFQESKDKKGRSRLEIRYYDLDGQHLSEYFYLNSESGRKAFYYNFSRLHTRLPERRIRVSSVEDAISLKSSFRQPLFVIARKQKYYWKIQEKIF